MARSRRKKVTEDTPLADETVVDQTADTSTDFNPAEFDPALKQQADGIVQSVADATRIDPEQPANGFAAKHSAANGHAAAVGKRSPDPFGIDFAKDGPNGVHLENSHRQKAYVIWFEKKPEPQEDGSKHPALKKVFDAGYRWKEVAPDQFAWKKPWAEGHFMYQEEQDARALVRELNKLVNPGLTVA